MKFPSLLLVVALASFAVFCSACPVIFVTGYGGTQVVMQQLSLHDKTHLLALHPAYADSGRAIYVAASISSLQPPLYLYHCRNEWTGVGLWELGSSLCESMSNSYAENTAASADNIAAFALSWAVAPHLIGAVADQGRAAWNVNRRILDAYLPITDVAESAGTAQSTGFAVDNFFSVYCATNGDTPAEQTAGPGVVYFESSTRAQPHLTGFYIQHTVTVTATATAAAVNSNNHEQAAVVVYTQVRESPTEDPQLYLFSLPSTVQCENEGKSAVNSEGVCTQHTTWLIGDRYGEDAGLAFTRTSQTVSNTDATSTMTVAATHATPPLPVPPQQHQWSFVDPSQGDQWTPDPTAVLYCAENESQKDNIYGVLRAARSLRSLPTGNPMLAMVTCRRAACLLASCS